MAKLRDRFYYVGGPLDSTVRLSHLNQSQRKAVFRYFDTVYVVMFSGYSSPHRRQQHCEEMIQVHKTKKKLLSFMEEVGFI